MKAKLVNEGIKHLSGRSEEEIMEFLKQPSWRIEDEDIVFKAYEYIIKEKPYIKVILEDMFKTVPRYRLMSINKNLWSMSVDNFDFFFNRSGSMGIYYRKQEDMDLLLKHNVSMQIPGNTTYAFSISMADEKPPKKEEEVFHPKNVKSKNPMKNDYRVKDI